MYYKPKGKHAKGPKERVEPKDISYIGKTALIVLCIVLYPVFTAFALS